jgi:dimethylaniline monooxygenase (N-oxide forming)
LTDRDVDFPLHPGGEDLRKYYQSYAAHFGLLDKIVFNVIVSSITRTSDDRLWALHLAGEQMPRLFDKVIVASGSEVTPVIPVIEGLDLFQGKFLHSQAFKKYEPTFPTHRQLLMAGPDPTTLRTRTWL